MNKVNGFFNSIKDKKVAFCGLGVSNFPVMEMFVNHGIDVTACDKRDFDALGENGDKAKKLGVKLSLGENYLKNLDVDIVFRTPGMRYYMDELVDMRSRGVVVTSEMELFFELCPCKIIAITGSDGKTTTTSIISEFLKAQGKKVYLGGNIGRPLLPEIEEIKPDDYAVVELSSFQLISMRTSPSIAVVTNVSPNHLDMHKDMQEYVDSKRNVLLHQSAFSKAVLNLDNEISNSFSDDVRGCLAKFSRQSTVDNGAFLRDNKIIYSDYGKKTEIIDINDIFIPGMHNVENYMAAISAVWGIVDVDTIRQVAKTFTGVEHRAEFVREFNGVKYYNDSIASSPTRTASGTLSLYDEKIILIAGGYDKNLDYTDLGEIICNKVKVLILMGNTAEKIEKATKSASSYKENEPVIVRVSNMEEAVNKAKELAVKGDRVSLSPASASFDLYKNFMERGIHFKNIVNSLK
ncbi:MAG: UDP-N-acetylmuramoyl-L-alanine--D-glutamate ligase [Oscillospiraceae bacterium]|nr:UDP-N-acetylmuramoyl-L-alanine--D-glutamate ligase [Oscillospiraceae bacterium]